MQARGYDIRNTGQKGHIGYDVIPYIEAYRERFRAQVHIPATTTMIDYLAECQIWTGTMDRGHGVVRIESRVISVQAYAFQLYYGPIPIRDMATHKPLVVPLVPRCVAALTKNCVHQEHLGLNPARTSHKWFRALTLTERQTIRRISHEESLDGSLAAKLDGQWRLPIARIARIVTFREGKDDPK